MNINNFKAISTFYRSLEEDRQDTTFYLKKKWEAELAITITEKEWVSMCEIQHSTTTSPLWREFCWKNLTRFFITPKIKSKQISNPQKCWRLCGETEADHSHVFWKCIKIKKYWEDLKMTMDNILGYALPNTCQVMYLGNIKEQIQKEDLYLVKIILAATKKAITKKWLHPDPLTQQDWIRIVEGISEMEKITFNIRLLGCKYDRQWRKWKAFRSGTKNTT